MKRPCGINGCNWFHHQLLHNTKYDKLRSSYTNVPSAPIYNQLSSSVFENIGHMRTQERFSKLFKILELKLQWRDKIVSVFGFLDDGAAPTIIDHSIYTSLG